MASIIIEGRLIDLFVFIIISASMYLSMQRAKTGSKIQIRPLPPFNAIEEAIGRAVESGKIVHYTTGTHSFQGQTAGGSSALAAGLSLLSYITDLCIEKGATLISSCPYPEIYTIEADIIRNAYIRRGSGDEYSEEAHLRYVPIVSACGPYAAGVSGWIEREKPAANFLLGPFFFESLIIAESGYHVGAFQVAGTTSAGYSAFFLACCDYVLLGEELYAAQALATNDPIQMGSLRGGDLNRVWIMVLIILGVLATTVGLKVALNGLLSM